MARVLIRNLNKKYDEVHAVKGVNLEIRDREFVVLVGPSGCGKTTTLRMVAGLESITSGDILIGETVVNNLPPMDRDIAMVFQNYALYPHMSVRDNMAFGLKMRKFARPEIDRRVRDAADILGIQNLLQRKPRQLSGGQRQRVALGRAIVRNPQVFLFDEPLSNLDATLRVQMRVELKKLHDRLGTTAIYVTHDQVEAMTLGDRVVVMRDGLVQQVGEPLDLYTINNAWRTRHMASFSITPLTDHTGAEVTGLDFRTPIDADVRTALNDAFVEHHVLVMRDQEFSPDDFKVAVQVFGELQPHDKKEHHVPGFPDVSYVSNDEFVNGRRIIPGETFHTDHSNHPRPPKATTLFAVDLPSSGGDTQYVNMHDAYDDLPEATKRKIDDLKAVHAYLSKYSPRPLGYLSEESRKKVAAARRASAGAHPSGEWPQGAVPQSGAHGVDPRHGR